MPTKKKPPPWLTKPDNLIVADMLEHYAKMARAGLLTGLAYVMIFDEEIVSGFNGQCWWEPHLALPDVEKLRQDLIKQNAWHAKHPSAWHAKHPSD